MPECVRFLFIDEPMILTVLGRMLSSESSVCFFSTTRAEDALAIIVREHIEVVWVDPSVNDGGALLADVARDHPHVVRVLMSGASDDATMAHAIDVGRADHVIDKPWGFVAFKDLVREAGDLARERRQ